MSHSIQVVARHDVSITSPTFGPNGELFTVSRNGDIYRYIGNTERDNEFQVESWGNSSGQPLGLLFDPENVAFVCDCAHQAIFRIIRTEDETGGAPRQEIEPYVKEYEASQLLGPNSVCMGRESGLLYFTDSGPLGETSLQNAKGSVFAINPATQLLIPLAYQCLAYPSGIALTADEKVLYVAETNLNRILRFTQSPPGVYHCTVFHQLSGRFGPTALAVSSSGDLFVAHFDFVDNTENGRIVVIDGEGEVTAIMSVPGPEITGLALTPDEKFLLITEGSGNSLYRHPLR
mmetsp:Transcript_14681/g.36654  ORF Transcript_14681/g.36654 Transcript_14681/m.36654 type:complete len:290 (+) Transcript_14681:139-1008(+)|eukprot:CAMPEP_0178994524 /NCGR_PEP_ID=MMETSP0795-20121207/7319_1 /TAXON_ID=88552 /ORGANISM="Amoebophrya sp., Strain Ameob2" /LENGTH=289 /DNA_ID=CAMNT_0020686729 /DNA_START=89 /DNA_END=958 /DNA_ORIENTATION=-